MRNKKTITFLAIVIAVIGTGALLLWIGNRWTLGTAHKAIINGSRAYEPYSIASDDGRYLLETILLDESTGTHTSFIIKSMLEQNVVFECSDQYRTRDLKSISWESLNVVVITGDVGTIKYNFFDGNWVKQ